MTSRISSQGWNSRHKDVLLCMRHQCSEKGSRKYYGVTSSNMERNQDHRSGMAYSLDGECSDVPVGTRDSLDLLIMRRDRLTEHINARMSICARI